MSKELQEDLLYVDAYEACADRNQTKRQIQKIKEQGRENRARERASKFLHKLAGQEKQTLELLDKLSDVLIPEDAEILKALRAGLEDLFTDAAAHLHDQEK